jgi:hypothetical protein
VYLKEVVQHVGEPQDVFTVSEMLGLPDTIDNNVPEFLSAVHRERPAASPK